jgi:hypothetical protein
LDSTRVTSTVVWRKRHGTVPRPSANPQLGGYGRVSAPHELLNPLLLLSKTLDSGGTGCGDCASKTVG